MRRISTDAIAYYSDKYAFSRQSKGPGAGRAPEIAYFSSLEVLFDLSPQLFGPNVGLKAGNDVSFFIDQELGKVPLYAVVAEKFSELCPEARLKSLALKALEALEGLFAAEEVVERMGILSPDVGLLEHLESDVVIAGAEALYFLVGAGLLPPELIAGES